MGCSWTGAITVALLLEPASPVFPLSSSNLPGCLGALVGSGSSQVSGALFEAWYTVDAG